MSKYTEENINISENHKVTTAEYIEFEIDYTIKTPVSSATVDLSGDAFCGTEKKQK